MKKVLLATDGSEASQHAEAIAMKLLTISPDIELTILYVSAQENYAYDFIPDVIDRYEETLSQQIKEEISQRLLPWKNQISFVHRSGNVSKTICDFAASINADLIIVGSHGRGAVDRALLGSVAEGVLHRSSISVLVAK